MMKTNKVSKTPGGITTRNRRRSKRQTNQPSQAPIVGAVVRPPASFMRGTTDIVPMHLKGSRALVNTYNGTPVAGSSNLAIALTPINIAVDGYTSLKQVFPVLNGMVASFTKFTVTRVRVSVRNTSAMTAGGYIAFCYESSGPSRVAPPTSILDASSGAHSAIVTPGTVGGFTLNTTDYENDWSELEIEAAKSDCGSIQFIGENSAAASAVIGIITIELDFFFTGYRVGSGV